MSQRLGGKINLPRVFARQRRSLQADLLWTAIAQLGVMISAFLVYGLISRLFFARGIGEFALVRRGLYFLQPVTLLGITVAVPRFLPFHQGKAERAQITAVGFACVMTFSVAVAIACVLKREWVASVLFGDRHAQGLALSFAAITVAFGFHSYIYSYFRGTMQMNAANALDFVNSAIAPLAAVTLSARMDVATVVFVLAVLMVLWTAFYSRSIWREVLAGIGENYCRALTKSLLRYGLARIPGDLALAGLMLVAPIVIAHGADLGEVGRFAIAQNLLMVLGAGLAPLSIVLLPHVSDRIAAGDLSTVKGNSVVLFHAIADTSVYFWLHVSILADVIVRLWVGEAMMGATELVRVLMIAAPFYTIYFVFRSVLDASSMKPITTINLVIAFGVFVICYAVLGGADVNAPVAAAWSLMVAYVILGALTLVALLHCYDGLGFFDVATVKIVLLNCAIAGGVLATRSLFSMKDNAYILVEAVALGVFWLGIVRVNRDWSVSLRGFARMRV